MSVPVFNEKTAAWISFSCYNKDRVLEVPGTLKYRIDCLSTNAEIRSDTVLTPASTGEIELLPIDTTLQSQDNTTELRVITVTADADTDTQHIEVYRYKVKNLMAVM